MISILQQLRLEDQPKLPAILQTLQKLALVALEGASSNELANKFPHTKNQPTVTFQPGNAQQHRPLAVGVVLSGGQAAGGHNVIIGLYNALTALHPDSRLIGFCDGPGGIIDQKTKNLDRTFLSQYLNQGGFDMIGSGRTKIETAEQFEAAKKAVTDLKLDGLVIIGGDDSNTNAALLAEFFKEHKVSCTVVGVPKTIDGDLKNEFIEVSFGFDTACKTYSEIIGNLLRDGLSAKKYYYFIKLMGRTASHIALECALQTHPNMTLIGEEMLAQGKTLHEIADEICEMICRRAEQGKNYGTVLIPEGIIEFVPEFKHLIEELNILLAVGGIHATKVDALPAGRQRIDYVRQLLKSDSLHCFEELPEEIQSQLLLERDPHGNIQVSKIETERLFIAMVDEELKKRKKQGTYKGKFSTQPLFCGYEGRAGMPTYFDSHYCYALGHVAALLVDAKCTGYMSCVQNLMAPVGEWKISGIPLLQMMTIERRGGILKPVVRKALVNLSGKPMQFFKEMRERWMYDDDYRYPGPIQFFGPAELVEAKTITLAMERK
jgi:pyrophosphate--fructose-6-phosphate 1-phosphotransferase